MAEAQSEKTEAKAEVKEAKVEKKAAAPEYPDTPSGKALAAVGNLDGEDVGPDGYEDAAAHGEAYQAEKKKHRWG
jgi:hypothetical protein